LNTPAHAFINLLILSRNPDHGKTAIIVSGAIIPDLFLILFYAWHKWLGTEESQIWSIEYYRPLWQAGIDTLHSLPLIMLAMLVCWKARKPVLLLLFTSMLLHSLGDFPLHHDDAHRHFFPFSEWRFVSPISYWDPAHYGNWASLLEIFIVLAISIFLYRRQALLRVWIITGLVVYGAYWIYVLLVWT